ncbi:VOC family protein [Mesobacterium sp. TK19101]|uniref:VOC family protein n=1 Tax=Mesobacterium hydrothermale TaxID=3111907 RepID=A0ABU6HLF0_9RHOB|nr:VOC family protein [Mesobacterium sp. TK19101]MEC3863280.1 VOC family protein [Mesobacterium sp. TK19101]
MRECPALDGAQIEGTLAAELGESTMKLAHVSLTARDADKLSNFYKGVFGFVDRRPPKKLSGELFSRGNGLPDVGIYSIWLNFPADHKTFLEIMEYTKTINRGLPAVNEPGYGHLAFSVLDLNKTTELVLQLGGSMQGEVTNFGTETTPHLIVYVRDPEGNILELDQPNAS